VLTSIGAEETFKGVVDLITMQAIVWNEEDQGMTFEVIDMPADLVETVDEWREKLLEAVAEYDESLLEKYFEDPDSITVEEVRTAVRDAVTDAAFVPMMCGSAFKNKGVQAVLDAVCAYLPSPLDIPPVKGTDPDDEEKILERAPSVDEPFAALAFKIATDPFVGRLAFMRVYSGVLEAGSYVKNTRSGNKERISRLYQMHANEQQAITKVEAGDIAAAVGFKDIRTGDTLCDEKNPIVLESMVFPDPVIAVAVEPKTQKDLDRLGMALAKLAEEDPTFTVKYDEDTNQTIIAGMGELHLEIIVDRLKREFKVEANVDEEFLESEDFKNGKENLQFEWAIVGGAIDKNYQKPVKDGFKSMMKNGILAGYNIDSMKVKVYDGGMHSVDSKPLAFELCAKEGFKAAAKQCNPTPEEYTGNVIGDLNRRRGLPKGQEPMNGGAVRITADVPLAQMFGYVTDLRTITSGRANSSMTFDRFAEAPQGVAKEVIAEARGEA